MRVFVSEYVCGGGWPEPTIAGSLAVEGRAMLCAVVEDLERIAGVQVETTWDGRLGAAPFRRARWELVDSRIHERRVFERLAAQCDATLVIAPEFDGILLNRCRIVEDAGGCLLGPESGGVALCTDKLRLARHLRNAGIETIPTESFDWNRAIARPGDGDRPPFPIVIKPRDGAGSQDTYLIRNEADLERLRGERLANPGHGQFIVQPCVAGRAASVAILVGRSCGDTQVLIPAAQHLSDDGRFRYLGGRMPLPPADCPALEAAALAASRSVPGLRGYVGVDLILPDRARDRPVVVEINPRLTTSYLGYRRLAETNLAEWFVMPERMHRPIAWRTGNVEFDSAGRIVPSSTWY